MKSNVDLVKAPGYTNKEKHIESSETEDNISTSTLGSTHGSRSSNPTEV